MQNLSGKVVLVTGASQGIGKGIAIALGEAGAKVYVTGRPSSTRLTQSNRIHGSLEMSAETITRNGGEGIAIFCDHSKDTDIEWLFEEIKHEDGRLDILVNNAWRGYEHYISDTSFCAPFWEQPFARFDNMLQVGLRSHLVTTRYALPLMFPQNSGLIINITTYLTPENDNCSLFYWTIKNSINLMTKKMAQQLKPHGITAVALAPDWTNTESMMPDDEDLPSMESVQFVGRIVESLAKDSQLYKKTGALLRTRLLAKEYSVFDVDGRQPEPDSYKVFKI